jgi:WD40 repeat protein/serine/threonine protein kinase
VLATEEPMVEKPTATGSKADHSLFGRRVGRFVIRELIGEGGCGAVYRCEQPALERDVVIKVIHERRRSVDGAADRFLREAKLASRLDHPYAAHVYDFGVEPEDRLMWLAMELVRGVTLGKWLLEHGPMPFEQFVPFFDRVCEVVQAAHDHKITHRDLKPSNIMLLERGGQMSPKLLDLGIAKTDRSMAPLRPRSWPDGSLGENLELEAPPEVREGPITASDPEPQRWYLTPPGSHMGSSAYMSPEQWINARGVGPASDIYSLGIIAYKSMTGREPFAANDADGYYYHHLKTKVPPLGEGFSASLDGVIQRALAKRAEDRFGTALEFASALRAELRAGPREQFRAASQQWHAHGRPRSRLLTSNELRAMQLPAAEVLSESEESFLRASRRHVTRNRRGLAALGVIAALGGLEYRSMLRTDAAEDRVTQGEMEQGRAALLHGELKDAQDHLGEAYRRGDHSWATEFMFARATQPRLAEQAVFPATFGRMWSIAWSPDGRQIATGDDRAVQVWDTETRTRLLTLPHGDTVYWIAYSADGARIFTACGDGAVRVWDAATGLLVLELRAGRQAWRYTVAAISGNMVTAMDGTGTSLHVWDTRTGEQLATLSGDGAERASIAWSKDGRWLAASGGDDVRVFDARTWTEVVRIPGASIQCLDFDPAGARLAVGTKSGDASMWDIPSGARLRHLREVGEPVDQVAFAPVGDLIAVATRDGSMQVWHDGKPQRSITTRSRIYALEFDPWGTSVLAATGEGTIVVADPTSDLVSAVLEGPSGLMIDAHFDPISRRIAGVSWDGTARVWNADPTYLRGGVLTEAPIPVGSQRNRTSPDGRLEITIPANDNPPELWTLKPSRHRLAPLNGHSGHVRSARFVDGEDVAVTAGADGTARLWDTRTGALVQTFRSSGASASRYLADAALHASLVVAGGGDGALRFWDRATGEQIWTLQASRSAIIGVDFAGDDVVSHDAEGHVARWVLASPKAVIRDATRIRATVAP